MSEQSVICRLFGHKFAEPRQSTGLLIGTNAWLGTITFGDRAVDMASVPVGDGERRVVSCYWDCQRGCGSRQYLIDRATSEPISHSPGAPSL